MAPTDIYNWPSGFSHQCGSIFRLKLIPVLIHRLCLSDLIADVDASAEDDAEQDGAGDEVEGHSFVIPARIPSDASSMMVIPARTFLSDTSRVFLMSPARSSSLM